MRPHNPTISVLMPVYNGEMFIREAIDSILNQTYPDFELIIINDGSFDNSEKIILSYNDPRIVYVKNEKNLRLIKTLNRGIDLAKGEYIARMDADDISVHNRFEKQINCFLKNIEIDIVNTQYFLLNDDSKSYRIDKTNLLIKTEAVKYLSLFQTIIAHPAVMIKTSLLKQFKYCESESIEHIEDFELWNRLFANGNNCYTIPEYLLYYRMNPNSITNTKGKEQVFKMNKITHSLLQEQYATDVDMETLRLLQGDFRICTFTLLKKIDLFLSSFFFDLRKNRLVSEDAYNEMVLWKKYKVFIICMKSLLKVDLVKKIEILMFLTIKTSWLKDKEFRARLFESISAKTFKRL